MQPLRLGSLFSGYGGLDMAANAVYGSRTAWHCDIDPGAAAILAHNHPDTPNHGDITAVDWATVEPVDILTGGFPCQDLSLAGKRAGLKLGTRSGLWFEMLKAISILQPRLVVLENVRGLLTKGETDHEPNDRCVCGWAYRRGGLHRDLQQQEVPVVLDQSADRDDDQGVGGAPADAEGVRGQHLALARGHRTVGLGGDMDGQWSRGGNGAASGQPVPATEGRAGADSAEGAGDPRCPAGEGARSQGVDAGGYGPLRDVEGSDARAEPQGAFDLWTGERVDDCPACGEPLGDRSDRSVVGSGMGAVLGGLAGLGFVAEWACVRASEVGAAHQRERVFLLAWRPAAADPSRLGHRDAWPTGERGVPAAAVAGRAPAPADADGNAVRVEPVTEPGRGRAAVAGLPRTEAAADPEGDGRHQGRPESARLVGRPDLAVGGAPDWGGYGPAVARWAGVVGRPAPRAVDDRGRLSPAFVEWLMGLPAGHVTDVPGLTRTAQLKALGNGVVPQQAEAAIRLLHHRATATDASAAA